jgi:hypothetical protein
METYFTKFPNTVYNDTSCTDITKRVSISQKILRRKNLFYLYEIENDLRPDQVSNYYYNDPAYEWLIYLQNEIIDPYYGWYISENDFNNMIVDTYGSYEKALQKIKYYQLNWFGELSDISVSFYNNNLPDVLKKYYVPDYGAGVKIVSYKLREEDWIVNTNKIMKLNLSSFITSNVNGNSFTTSEIVNIKQNYATSETTANAEVVVANSTVVTIKNVEGSIANNFYVVQPSTNTIAQYTNSEVISQNIPSDETIYWTAISCYEYERRKNEANKTIRLLDSNFALEAAENLRVKLLD